MRGYFAACIPLTPTLGNRSLRCPASRIHALVALREREKRSALFGGWIN